MFSIIIPAYNEEKYILPCLESIKKLQGNFNYEVIVVNNASTDDTAGVVKRTLPEAKVVFEPRKGLTIAYNRGAKEAKGDILVFVDADMALPSNHLERINKEFSRDPELVAVSGPYIYKDGGLLCHLLTASAYLFLAMPAEIIFNRWLNLGASLASGNSSIKKKALEKAGWFNEKIFYGLEPNLAMRLKKKGKVRFKYYLSAESSARRFKKEGLIKSLFKYSINTIWPILFGKPFTRKYKDIR